MTDLAVPTAVRRTVAFSRAVYEQTAEIEASTAVLCRTIGEVESALRQDRDRGYGRYGGRNSENMETGCRGGCHSGKAKSGDFHAGCTGCDRSRSRIYRRRRLPLFIETKRGHYLGRCIYRGSAIPNSGVPGNIGGYTTEQLLRAPCAGVFEPAVSIGDLVQTGDVCGTVNGVPMRSQIPGVVRGLLQRGVMVTEGMKSGDVDPRCEPEHCHTVSDKARAIGGGVLGAILHLTRKIQKREQ